MGYIPLRKTINKMVDRSQSEGALPPAGSSHRVSKDSLVAQSYPSALNIHHIGPLNVLFRDGGTPMELARTYLQIHLYTASDFTAFLMHVMENATKSEDQTRAAQTLSLYSNMLETPHLEAVSGYEWNGDELDHLFVKFVLGSASSHIAPDVPMSGM